MSYKTIIEEGLNYPPTKELAEETKESYEKGFNVKTAIGELKSKLKEKTKEIIKK